MSKKTTIPVSTGLFTPEHYKNIGPAIWTFEILIDMVTNEYVEDGERWGKVLGGAPVPADKIADRIGAHPETIKEHLRRLKLHGYIRTRRLSRGEAIDVRKSIKWLMRNHGASSGPSNQQVIAELVQQFRTIPGVEAQARDFGIMGNIIKKHGADKVTLYLTKLRNSMQLGQVGDPRAWLIGTLDKVDKKETLGLNDGLKSAAEAWTEVLDNMGKQNPEWSNPLIAEAVKQLGGIATIGNSAPGAMMRPFMQAYTALRTRPKTG